MPARPSRYDDDFVEAHEINVTPFIDVMLVLLIIFMIAAPLATVDIPVNLPAANAEPQPRPDKPIFLTVKRDLSLALGEAPIGREMLTAALDAATGHNRQQTLFLRADRSVAYGDVMEVMNALRTAGYRKVALLALENRDGK